MNALLDQLLGLRSLSTRGAGVEFRFAHDLPAWGWTLALVACAVVAAWGYWRLLGRRWARVSLATVRSALLALILALIAGPELVRPNERVEKDWVIVMADRSASMTVADAPTTTPPSTPSPTPATRAPRERQLQDTLRAAWPTLATLARDRNVLYLGFDGTAFPLRTIDGPDGRPSGVDLGQPQGRRTAVGQSLDAALQRVAARPIAGIVMLTDGRSSDTPSRATLKELESRQIAVYPVPLGSADPIVDLAVARVDAPSAAFIGDIVPVTAEIQALGDPGKGPPPKGHVQLIENSTGRVLDERPLPDLTADAASARVTLTTRPDTATTPTSPTSPTPPPTTPGPGAAAAPAGWTVKIVPDSPDLSPDNNAQGVAIDIVDRPIRVAYFDGYPRWEYRYVKNLLLREKSVRSSTMLLASNRRYIQEGTDLIDLLPRTPQEWAAFDVLILGDLRPGLFSDDQIRQVRALVAERGAGLLWIGGSSATPAAWRDSPLADLLPFTGGPGAGEGSSGPQPWATPVIMRPGPAARRYGVLQLGDTTDDPWPATLSTPELGWPLLHWAQRLEPASLKPTAEIIALAQPATPGSLAPGTAAAPGGSATSAAPTPVVLTMRFGAGRVVYVATDETWRYRYGKGEQLTERFWIPLIRLLARESLGRAGKPAVLAVSPERAQVNQQVQVTVRLLDQSLLDRRAQSVKVRLAPRSVTGAAAGDARSSEILLKPQTLAEGSSVQTFAATWVADEPGIYTVDSQDPLLAGLGLEARLDVTLPDDELRVPQTDHAALELLAAATGGRTLTPAQLAELPGMLPNRQITLQGTPDVETLWDKPIVWGLLITLLAAEWIGRRLIKLP